jgi:prevent-host-death family protein
LTSGARGVWQELRNQVSDVLRRVEAGETLTVTVAGREVAELSPVQKHRRVSGPALDLVWRGPTPQGLEKDLVVLAGVLSDPYEK